MYKIFAIFIVIAITSCLAQQRAYRFRNKRIPYEDDDYREDNFDDEPNDVRDDRHHEHSNNGPMYPNQPSMHNMNRHPNYDVGARNPYPSYNRGPPYGIYGQQYQQPVQPIPSLQQPLHQQQSIQPQSLQSQQPQPQPQPQSADGTRASYNGYGYPQYPYGGGWTRPAYGWNRPVSTGWSLGFPFNLFGFGGTYRPSWGWGNRFGLFF